MARTQKDRDEDLALGRELERKDAEIERLRPYVEAFRREEARADKLGSRVDDLNAEIERLRAELQWIADQRFSDRCTVTPETAWEDFGKLNASVCAIYDRARAAIDHGLPTADDVRGILQQKAEEKA